MGHERGVMVPRVKYKDGTDGKGKDRDKLRGLRVTFVIYEILIPLLKCVISFTHRLSLKWVVVSVTSSVVKNQW